MIASDRQALAIGTARLVVDGTDESLCRKAEFSLCPGRSRARRLRTLVELSCEVYNAALENRRDAWRMAGVGVSAFDQFNEIPELRKLRPDVASFGNQFVRGSISRVDEAFSGFFRRVKAGETPGFPRFKAHKRFRSAFYGEPYCWALKGLESDDPTLYVQGVGKMPLSNKAVRQLRRLTERGGVPRTLTITGQPSGSWRACVGFRAVVAKRLPPKTEVGGVDRGIAVTAALPDGTLLEMPKFLAEARDEIAEINRLRELEKNGSSEWRKLNKQVAKAYRKARQRSENWARHSAIEIVARYGVIALEWLKLVNMTKSARGTKENPGKNVKAKSGLNRSLQDAALGRLAFWICVRAEEAGRRVYKVNPVDSSRQCAACGHIDPKNRVGARFYCLRCHHRGHADVNAAQVIAARGQVADATWVAMGSPTLTRAVARKRRRKQDGAGSAPYAAVA